MADHYTIRELTAEFGVTSRTLRHYEEIGLLRPERQGVARLFSARDRARLRLALRSKKLGYTLQDIRELFDLYDTASTATGELASLLERLEQTRRELEQQREDLDMMLGEIRFFADQCRRVMAGSTGIRIKPGHPTPGLRG